MADVGSERKPTVWIGIFISLLLALGVIWISDRLPAHHEQGCSYAEQSWPRRQIVARSSPGSLLFRPSLAMGNRSGYVIGSLIPIQYPFRSVSVTRISFGGWTLAGLSIGRPPMGRWFVYPQGVVDDEGGLNVIWGEPDALESINLDQYMGLPASHLVYARYMPGQGWSEAKVVLRDVEGRQRINWLAGSTGSLLDSTGRLHVVVPMFPSHIVHLTIFDGKVKQDTIDAPGITSVSIAAFGSTGIIIAYSGSGPPMLGVGRAVLLRQLVNGNDRWSNPILVAGSGRGVATTPYILVSREGVLYLVWKEHTTTGTTPTVIRLVTSSDEGLSWSTPSNLVLPVSAFLDWKVAIDRNATVHLVYSTLMANGARRRFRVGYAQWHEKWGTPIDMLDEDMVRDIGIAPGRDGHVHFVGSVQLTPFNELYPQFEIMQFPFPEGPSLPCSQSTP